MGCVFAYVIILTLLGPEKLGNDLGVEGDRDLGEATGIVAVEKVAHGDGSNDGEVEKGEGRHIEG